MSRPDAVGRASAAFPYRAVLSDIDGTLLGAGRRLSPRTGRAVRRLHEAGVPFALATGRMPGGVAGVPSFSIRATGSSRPQSSKSAMRAVSSP